MRKDSICIILARKNSKGLKNKNIKKFLGKPLIYHTIKPVLESKLFDKILVSTDSALIQNISKKYGIEAPFLRPKILASSTSSYSDALLHSLKWVKKNYGEYKYVYYTYPTNPLRVKSDIVKAYKILCTNPKIDLVASVTEDRHPVFWSGILKKNLSLKNFIKKKYCKNRQELPKTFHIDGSIFFGKWNVFFKRKNFYEVNSMAITIPSSRSVDIDNILDFEFAKILKKLS